MSCGVRHICHACGALRFWIVGCCHVEVEVTLEDVGEALW